MEVTRPIYGKALAAALRERPRIRRESDASGAATTPSRVPARLFRRTTPTTFHRFLAVHMHFAQHHSALD
jgi:hypothetical protein